MNISFFMEFKKDNVLIPFIKEAGISILDLIVDASLAKSRSDARRLMEQGGFKINDITFKNPNSFVVHLDSNECFVASLV